MPTSNLHLAADLCWLVERTGARTVLDVGPGHGKYGVLLKEYSAVERVDAVEMWEPYIDAFGLEGIYGTVHRGDVCDLPDEVLAVYDCVFMGDVIEHIDKGRANALLDRIPGWVVICTPSTFFAQPHEVPTEHHVSHWVPDDFWARPELDEVSERMGGLLVRLKPKVALHG
jgi:2-polyprenyl-3-methyl-5-hydroxy-6-metoxy-1,4-benzoquinol methylase